MGGRDFLLPELLIQDHITPGKKHGGMEALCRAPRGEGWMKGGGGGEAGGKVKGTSSAHCWGLENGCGAEGKG